MTEPVWKRIYNTELEKLRSNFYAPGQFFASVNTLAERYGVSTITSRSVCIPDGMGCEYVSGTVELRKIDSPCFVHNNSINAVFPDGSARSIRLGKVPLSVTGAYRAHVNVFRAPWDFARDSRCITW